MRKIFPACCASTITPRASSTTATRIDGTAAFFIAHLISSVIYHVDRDKGKCDLHGGMRQGFVEGKNQNQPRIELNDATVASCRIDSMEKSIQSWHRCLVFCHHLITLFARANTSAGIISPICFAALRLMTNSKFIACCTGRSPGFAPLRILSTYWAARR